MTTTFKPFTRIYNEVSSPYLRMQKDKFLKACNAYTSGRSAAARKPSKPFGFFSYRPFTAVDLGAGNGRNLQFLKDFLNIPGKWMAVDADPNLVSRHAAQYIDRHTVELGKAPIPCDAESVDAILCQYLLMFMDEEARLNLLQDITRIAARGAVMLIELYPAKKSHTPCDTSVREMAQEVRGFLQAHDWKIDSQNELHFFATKL